MILSTVIIKNDAAASDWFKGISYLAHKEGRACRDGMRMLESDHYSRPGADWQKNSARGHRISPSLLRLKK
jgi:hypothetical protein